MPKAIYTTKNEGHYGLGFEYYTHFTSPIRRYPDVLVHRLLEARLHHKTYSTKDELEFIKKAVFSLTRRIKDKEELGYYQPEMSYQVLNEIDPNLTK